MILCFSGFSSNFCPLKRLIQGYNNVTKTRVKPMIMQSGSSSKQRLCPFSHAADYDTKNEHFLKFFLSLVVRVLATLCFVMLMVIDQPITGLLTSFKFLFLGCFSFSLKFPGRFFTASQLVVFSSNLINPSVQ